ncbi:MAG: hypothetical protein ACSLEM_03895 [Candidatus Malihini olakiniferum]
MVYSGSDKTHLLDVTTFLADAADFDAINMALDSGLLLQCAVR